MKFLTLIERYFIILRNVIIFFNLMQDQGYLRDLGPRNTLLVTNASS